MKLLPNSPLTASGEQLLPSGRLESGDFDDLAFVRVRMSDIDEMAELGRRELAEWASDAEASDELQGVVDILETEDRGEHDVLCVVVVYHAPAVARDLRACGLAGGGRRRDDLEIEPGPAMAMPSAIEAICAR